jgi:hypothetical protein
MRLPGYSDDDNAFYARAVANYPDHDPVKARKATRWAGPVYLQDQTRKNSYTQEEVNEIVKQGRDRPRPLTHDETELFNTNRREARGDLAAMESWYRTECRDNDQKRAMLRRYPTGTANYGHEPRKSDDGVLRGIELSDQFWQPVVW